MNEIYNDIIRNLILAAGCKQKIEKNTCNILFRFQTRPIWLMKHKRQNFNYINAGLFLKILLSLSMCIVQSCLFVCICFFNGIAFPEWCGKEFMKESLWVAVIIQACSCSSAKAVGLDLETWRHNSSSPNCMSLKRLFKIPAHNVETFLSLAKND